jgi:hypothetical protein
VATRRKALLCDAAHVILGSTLAIPFFVLGWEVWNSWGILDPDHIDTEIWWWWVPFWSMGLLTTILTFRLRDRRLFWRTMLVLWASLAGSILILHLAAQFS